MTALQESEQEGLVGKACVSRWDYEERVRIMGGIMTYG